MNYDDERVEMIWKLFQKVFVVVLLIEMVIFIKAIIKIW